MGVSEIIGKLFGGKSETESPLRAYGKLPLYAEYRRLEVSPGAPTLFTQWLDAGRLAWARSATRSDGGAVRATRLLVQIPGAREFAVASLWDSRDSLGRVFPFAFFVVCPAESLGANAVEQWTSACALHATFDSYYSELRTLNAGGDFYRQYLKRMLPLRPADLVERARALQDAAAHIELAAWFNAWQPNGGADAGPWLVGIQQRSVRLRAQPEVLAETALSCPLPASHPPSVQVAIWLDWLAPSLQKAARPVSIILPAPEGKSGMVHIVPRALLPDDFQLMTTDDATYAYVERLNAASAAPAAAPPAVEPAPIAPASPFLLESIRGASA